MENNRNFGQFLKDLRTQADLTLKVLADQVGIDASYLSKIENGVLPAPSENVISKLAEALKIDKIILSKSAGLDLDSEEILNRNGINEFGKKLKKLRIRAGMSQSELAAKSGVAPSYLSKIESGAKSPPSQKVVSRLAEALNTDKEVLLIQAGRKKYKKDWNSLIQRRLNNFMKMPTHSIMKSMWSKAAVAAVLVITIVSVLWFATPAQAVNVSFPSLPASGTLGNIYTFTMKVDVENTDLLPITQIDLQIRSLSSSNSVTCSGLPLLQTSTPQIFNTTGGTFYISATPATNWGYGFTAINRYGYGYGYQTGVWDYVQYPTGWGYGNNSSGYGYGYGGVGYGYGLNLGPTSITYSINWSSPASWPAGNYRAVSVIYGEGNISSALSNAESATFTLAAPSTGGGTGPAPTTSSTATSTATATATATATSTAPATSPTAGTTNISNAINAQGAFTQAVTAKSADNNVTISIAQGVVGKTASGQPLSAITVVPMTTPPTSSANVVGIPYDLGPAGATFNPAITISFKYDPTKIPAGSTPVLAFFDTTTNQWVELTNVKFDAATGTISGDTTHFTAFAVIAKAPATTATKPASTPPTSTTPAAPSQTTTTTATSAPPSSTTTGGGTNWGLIIGIIAAVIIIIAIVMVVVRRKK